MGWLKFAGVCCLAVLLTACGGAAAGSPTPDVTAAVAPTSPPSVSQGPAASPAIATASPAAARAATAVPTTEAPTTSSNNTVWVGNTDGEGVFLRKTPAMADRLNAYADGTPLTVVGDDVDADGQHWKHVKAPDGTEGYVPAMYTVDTQP